MRLNKKALLVSVLLGLLVGTVDTILDYIYFYKGENFLELLIFNVPKHEIYIRSVIFFCFIVFGVIAGNTISQLQEALQNVKLLTGFLPICAKCKKIRDEKGYWNQVEKYISDHSEAVFSHGICEECSDKLYGANDWYNKKIKDKDNN